MHCSAINNHCSAINNLCQNVILQLSLKDICEKQFLIGSEMEIVGITGKIVVVMLHEETRVRQNCSSFATQGQVRTLEVLLHEDT